MTTILVADDERLSRDGLAQDLKSLGYDVVTAHDGISAMKLLIVPDAPRIAIVDWTMPNLDGVDLVRVVRKRSNAAYTYIILLTARTNSADVIAGLNAGADDFIKKPYEKDELQSRIAAGERVLKLEETLRSKVKELEAALTEVKTLQGLLPICMHCKRIRDDRDTWQGIETYIASHSAATFSHSMCESCYKERYPE